MAMCQICFCGVHRDVCARARACVCAVVALAPFCIPDRECVRLHWSLLVMIGTYPASFRPAQVLPLGTAPIFLHSLLRAASVVKEYMCFVSSLQFLSP